MFANQEATTMIPRYEISKPTILVPITIKNGCASGIAINKPRVQIKRLRFPSLRKNFHADCISWIALLHHCVAPASSSVLAKITPAITQRIPANKNNHTYTDLSVHATSSVCETQTPTINAPIHPKTER